LGVPGFLSFSFLLFLFWDDNSWAKWFNSSTIIIKENIYYFLLFFYLHSFITFSKGNFTTSHNFWSISFNVVSYLSIFENASSIFSLTIFL
jgi:hypothetical protein